MNILTCIVEIGATYIECILILSAIISATGQRFSGWKNQILLLSFSMFSTALVNSFNILDTFSYITPIVSMVFIIFITSAILSVGTVISRSIVCVLSMLVIQCLDYIIVILIGHFIGRPDEFFDIFVSTPGIGRIAFLFFDKFADMVVFLSVRRHLSGLSRLNQRLSTYLFLLSITAYIVMQVLFQVVLVPDLPIMQLAVVASWCFLIGFIVALIAFFLALTKQEQDCQRLEMLHSENVLMAENYKALHTTQQTYARTVHDFKHHMTVLRDFISTEKTEAALGYVDSLLKSSYHQATQCHSGNDIVDAIINSKLSEARTKDIKFTFMANLHIPIQIDPVDLCGVLANQLDNAFEACVQIPDPAQRLVHTEIKQVQSFVILRVENTALSDPFVDNPNLNSTKLVSSPHGYGLLNIQSIAQKYEGSLRMEFANGRFVSVVSLCDLPFDTNNSTV